MKNCSKIQHQKVDISSQFFQLSNQVGGGGGEGKRFVVPRKEGSERCEKN